MKERGIMLKSNREKGKILPSLYWGVFNLVLMIYLSYVSNITIKER